MSVLDVDFFVTLLTRPKVNSLETVECGGRGGGPGRTG
jgi:hypothetical protein